MALLGRSSNQLWRMNHVFDRTLENTFNLKKWRLKSLKAHRPVRICWWILSHTHIILRSPNICWCTFHVRPPLPGSLLFQSAVTATDAGVDTLSSSSPPLSLVLLASRRGSKFEIKSWLFGFSGSVNEASISRTWGRFCERLRWGGWVFGGAACLLRFVS